MQENTAVYTWYKFVLTLSNEKNSRFKDFGLFVVNYGLIAGFELLLYGI